MVLTALTTWVAFIDLGRLNVVIMLGIALTKATLVVLYFMHMRYSTRLTWMVLSSGIAILMLLVVLTAVDMIVRVYPTAGPSQIAAPPPQAFSAGAPALPQRPLARPEH
jgi:cytochrome c oxidase subunit 4